MPTTVATVADLNKVKARLDAIEVTLQEIIDAVTGTDGGEP